MSVISIGIFGASATAEECTFCPDGSNVTTPEKELSFLKDDFDGIPTCQSFADHLSYFDASSDACMEAQLFSPVCGCPVNDDACALCPEEGSTPDPEKHVPQFKIGFEHWDVDPPTCELVEALIQSIMTSRSGDCKQNQSYNFLCGCTSPQSWKEPLLVWLPRISATISFIGSTFIIQDVLRGGKKRRTTYHELVLVMSIFDGIASIAWAFSSLPVPGTDDYGDPSYVYGAKGNDATCTAQGFFIQLGLTSPFYNLSLAIYYMLVVSFGWKEDRMKKTKPWMHAIPLLVGFGLAFGGIPVYDEDVIMCYVREGNDEGYRNRLIFLIVPICTVVAGATVATLMVYFKVLRQERLARRWTMGRGRSSVQGLPRKVFWQSFWYLTSFYVSWPFIVAIQFVNVDSYNIFWFLGLVMFLVPIQGFLNFFVYTRPRLQRYLAQKRIARARRRDTVKPTVKRTCDRKDGGADRSSTGMDETVREVEKPDEETLGETSLEDPSAAIAKNESRILVAEEDESPGLETAER